MKKLISLLLVFAATVVFFGCADGNNGLKSSPEDAETVAKKYVECLYNAEFSEAEQYVAFSSEVVIKESAQLYPDDLSYNNGKVEIDGESFETVGDMINAVEEMVKGMTLTSAVKKGSQSNFKRRFRKTDREQLFDRGASRHP